MKWAVIINCIFLQVRCGDRHQLVPDNSERFEKVVCVIGREPISSGKHYWEVWGFALSKSQKSWKSLLIYYNSVLYRWLNLIPYCFHYKIQLCDKQTNVGQTSWLLQTYMRFTIWVKECGLFGLKRWTWPGRLTGTWVWSSIPSAGRGRLNTPQTMDSGSSV